MYSIDNLDNFQYNQNVLLICILDHNYDTGEIFNIFLPYCNTLIVSKVTHSSPCRTCYKLKEKTNGIRGEDFSFDDWMSIFEDEIVESSYHFVLYADLKNKFSLVDVFNEFWYSYKLAPYDIRIAMWFAIISDEERLIHNIDSSIVIYFKYVYKINYQKLEKIAIEQIEHKKIEDIQEYFRI